MYFQVIQKDDWPAVRRNFQKLESNLFGPRAVPPFTDLTLSNFASGNETIAHALNDTINCGELHPIVVTDETGINISWSSGVLWDCIAEDIVTTDLHVSTGCVDDNINYLYWDRSGGGTALTLSTTAPDYEDNDILIAIITCQSGDIFEIHSVNILSQRENDTNTAIRDILRVVVVDGLIVSKDTNVTNAFDVEITAGTFYHFGTTRHNLATGFNTRTTAMTRWYHSGGDWTFDSDAEIDMTEGTAGINRYDNLTGRVDGAANKYYKSMFMYSENMIHWIYPQAEYDTIAQAIAAPLPIIPAVGEYFPRSVAVIMKGNDTAFPTAGGTRWIDIRPLFGTSITGVITDHGNLAGLGDKDHSAYLPRDGTAAMTGSLYLTEAAAASGDTGGLGQVWVKNDTPNTVWFTDDTGVDHQLGTGGGGGMTYKRIKVTGQAEGDLHLSDGATWAVSKSLIKYIQVITSSTAWDLYILQNDNGYAANDATIPMMKIADNIIGNATLWLDLPYEDEDASGEVHLYYVDNSGANTATIIVKGLELA